MWWIFGVDIDKFLGSVVGKDLVLWLVVIGNCILLMFFVEIMLLFL